MQPDGMQMSRFWLLAILSEHLITAEPENGLMYLKVYIFKAFYTNLINSHRCELSHFLPLKLAVTTLFL